MQKGGCAHMDVSCYIPDDLLARYEFYNYNHALEIITQAFPEEWNELLDCLRRFQITIADLQQAGGNETNIPKKIDDVLYPLRHHQRRRNHHPRERAERCVQNRARQRRSAHSAQIRRKHHLDGQAALPSGFPAERRLSHSCHRHQETLYRGLEGRKPWRIISN